VPEPVYGVVTATTDDLKYWIIGVICGAVLIMFLIFIIVCWRWKTGGPPQEKVPPAEDEVDALAAGGANVEVD